MTSGVWAGLAADLADGTFYRPVHADDGFGGTRYMPLHFVLHGLLLSIIKQPAVAAHMVVFAAAVALISGLYRLLRQFDLSAQSAAACAVMALAALTIQYGLISTRGDMLAAALNVWGLSMCAARISGGPRRMIAFAGLFFALAFMTKFTTIFGICASVTFFAFNKRWRDAFELGTLTTALTGVMLIAVHLASDGRALDSFLACASGGTTPRDLLLSPFKFLYSARIDVSFLLFFACGCAVFLLRRRPLTDLPSASFLFTAAATIVIMASPGTDLSHLIDLQAASVVLVAVHVFPSGRPRALIWALPVAGAVGAVAVALTAVVLTYLVEDSRWEQQDRIMEIVGKGAAPMLADDPWVPILAGERPFVLDTFAIRTVSEQRPEVRDDLFQKLDDRYFRAVVLYLPKHLRDDKQSTNGTWRGKRWYGEMFYPPGFEERVLGAYEPEAFIGEYIVLLPKR